MNSLILSLLICPYLVLSNQLDLLPIQSLLLTIFFSIIYISQEIISGNLTSTISDHLPQFLIRLHIFSNTPNKKSNIFEHDWSKIQS